MRASAREMLDALRTDTCRDERQPLETTVALATQSIVLDNPEGQVELDSGFYVECPPSKLIVTRQ